MAALGSMRDAIAREPAIKDVMVELGSVRDAMQQTATKRERDREDVMAELASVREQANTGREHVMAELGSVREQTAVGRERVMTELGSVRDAVRQMNKPPAPAPAAAKPKYRMVVQRSGDDLVRSINIEPVED